VQDQFVEKSPRDLEEENDLPVLTNQIYKMEGYMHSNKKKEMGNSPMTAGSSNGGLRGVAIYSDNAS
jgi:hypothetical protein